jgi:uncharacterized membrane protein YfcA
MIYLVLSSVAFLASLATLFSGFGLGTVLLPVFAVYYPLPLAVALCAVVHLMNNLFKFILLGHHADLRVVLRFGIPAALAAVAGAWMLNAMGSASPLWSYSFAGSPRDVTMLGLLIGGAIIGFAVLEGSQILENLQIPPRWLPLGGVVSGFLGGVSGHQGALRSAFLLRAGLSKDAFIATGVVLALVVDLSRLSIYGATQYQVWSEALRGDAAMVTVAAVLAACGGAFLGIRILHKVTIHAIRWIVSLGMMGIGAALMAGLI